VLGQLCVRYQLFVKLAQARKRNSTIQAKVRGLCLLRFIEFRAVCLEKSLFGFFGFSENPPFVIF